MCTVPQITTDRLKLRAHSAADHAAATELWQTESVYKHITGKPLSEQDVWMRLLRYSGLWDFLGYGYWAVEDLSTGRYIGQLGFADFKRGLGGFDSSIPEAGWIIHPEFSGRGIASEGMQAACDWLDDHTDWERSFCIIALENKRSIHLAGKLGYCYKLDTKFGDETTPVFFREGKVK